MGDFGTFLKSTTLIVLTANFFISAEGKEVQKFEDFEELEDFRGLTKNCDCHERPEQRSIAPTCFWSGEAIEPENADRDFICRGIAMTFKSILTQFFSPFFNVLFSSLLLIPNGIS